MEGERETHVREIRQELREASQIIANTTKYVHRKNRKVVPWGGEQALEVETHVISNQIDTNRTKEVHRKNEKWVPSGGVQALEEDTHVISNQIDTNRTKDVHRKNEKWVPSGGAVFRGGDDK